MLYEDCPDTYLSPLRGLPSIMTSTSMPACELSMSLASGAMALALGMGGLQIHLEWPKVAPILFTCNSGLQATRAFLSMRWGPSPHDACADLAQQRCALFDICNIFTGSLPDNVPIMQRDVMTSHLIYEVRES